MRKPNPHISRTNINLALEIKSVAIALAKKQMGPHASLSAYITYLILKADAEDKARTQNTQTGIL